MFGGFFILEKCYKSLKLNNKLPLRDKHHPFICMPGYFLYCFCQTYYNKYLSVYAIDLILIIRMN